MKHFFVWNLQINKLPIQTNFTHAYVCTFFSKTKTHKHKPEVVIWWCTFYIQIWNNYFQKRPKRGMQIRIGAHLMVFGLDLIIILIWIAHNWKFTYLEIPLEIH